MKCAKCGSPLRPGAMFCGECGARVDPAAAGSPPTAAPLIEPPAASDPRSFAPPTAPPPPPPPPGTVRRTDVPPPPPPPVPSPPPASASVPAQERAATAQPTVDLRRAFDPQRLAPAAPEIAPDLEETLLSPRRRTAWRIVTAAGDRHAIATPTVIGRSPTPRPGAVTLALIDPGKSLSKSHALLDIVGDALYIEDLGSTNGTIVHDGSVELDLAAGQRTALSPGMTLELGEYILTIARD